MSKQNTDCVTNIACGTDNCIGTEYFFSVTEVIPDLSTARKYYGKNLW